MVLFDAVKKVVDRHYQAMAATDCNTCHVGAWVIHREQFRMENSGGHDMKTFFRRFTRRKENVAQGNTECSVRSVACDDKKKCKILVVCKNHTFSENVVNYAIDMATRTRSQLVALNLNESGRNFEEFHARAQQSISAFSDRADKAGLRFSHEVRQGAHDSVIDKMYQEDSQFKYVMDDSAAVCRSKAVIPVYTRATLRAK